MAEGSTSNASTSSDADIGQVSKPNQPETPEPALKKKKYRHVDALHLVSRNSCLSRDADSTPSFIGFRNLTVLALIVMNLRLVIENFLKYGVLICIRCHEYQREDVILGAILYALVPLFLLVAYLVELFAAKQAVQVVGQRKKNDAIDREQERRDFLSTWRTIASVHTVNATFCLSMTSYVVFHYIYHPGIGTMCEVHALIVWLKVCSYAFTNRDLRHAMLYPGPDANVPELYDQCPYPNNITVQNLTYFWWAPTLVYQPVYPRTTHIRWGFFLKRLMETAGLSVFIWLASAQYAAPLLQNSVGIIARLNVVSILERLMKLSTISVVIWLAGFFALFQSFLNALAEIMRFGDRNFYDDWWNSTDLRQYWATWNKPVYYFMKRHVYSPLVGRGWSPKKAGAAVFILSGFLHELLVGVPTHNILGVAFGGMVAQLLLMSVTEPLSKGGNKIFGNCVFWASFCFVGQPAGALMYFFAWQAKFGSVSKYLNE